MNTEAITRTAAKAENFSVRLNAPKPLASIANLIRYAKGPEGINWIADNCEAQAQHVDNEIHAAQFRVIAKRLRRAVAA